MDERDVKEPEDEKPGDDKEPPATIPFEPYRKIAKDPLPKPIRPTPKPKS